MVSLVGWSMAEPLVPDDEVLLGKSAKDISSYVVVHFASEIRIIALAFAATAIACGLLLGVAASLVLWLRSLVQGRRVALAGPRTFLVGLGIVALIHAFTIGLSMATWPQFYSKAFYLKEGWRAWVQVAVADHLGWRGVTAVFSVALVGIVVGGPRAWPRVFRRLRRRWRWAWVPLAGVAAFAAFQARPSRSSRSSLPARAERQVGTPTSPQRPNVVVLASDGLRNDRFEPRWAPRLSDVAERGTRFERAYTTLPRTLSSWATMLTGKYAFHHGLRSGMPRWEESSAVADTLPSALRAAGYETVAVSDFAGDVFKKVDFGFEVVNAPKFDFVDALWQRGIARATPLLPLFSSALGRRLFPAVHDMQIAVDPAFVADAAIETLRRPRQSPLFLVVFFSTTHFPYAAPAPYFAQFSDPHYGGPFRYEKQVTSGIRIVPNADDERQIRGLYEGAVAAVDAAAGRVLDELTRQGMADDTVVVVTSDHGETLFEHGRWHGHGDHLFGDEGIHVPLAIFDPRTPMHRREQALVSNVDFAPTIFELTGVTPLPDMDGRSLARAVRGSGLTSEVVFAETELWMGTNPGISEDLRVTFPPLFELFEIDDAHGSSVVVRKEQVLNNLLGRHRMARDDRFKLLYMPTKTGVVYRLYDTQADPEELVDVRDRFPAEAERLRNELLAWLARDPMLHVEGDRLTARTP